MSAVLQAPAGRPPDVRLRESRLTTGRDARLRRAAATLRAIRQRYETGRLACPGARSYSVHVAVDQGDMGWIAAAIDAVEEAVAAGASESTA
ncbi:MAG TPA: hypothetical protein VMT66_13025 [Steroidobacteraceae bacterium]|nr:hypothetical protein [Steroidobacteraceae bacterium]